jgi:acyl-CoA reductase-like NAD-dependent aldehyde dehydrogenase
MRYKMSINGKLVEGVSTVGVEDPATGAVFEQCPIADEVQLDRAVSAAKAAFPAWAKRTYADRGVSLDELADAIEENAGKMATLLTREQGKPLSAAHEEIDWSIAFLRFSATQDLPDKTVRDNETELIVETRTPLGVVAAITPWNYPVLMLVMKIGPALLSGNTVVAKPAPNTPLTTLFLGELALSVLPAGVLNVITITDDLGTKLTCHPDVAKVSFTGSTRTGIYVLQSVSRTLAQRVQTGTMWINSHMNFSFDVPLGGAEQSGMGVQLEQEGLEEFTQLKVISAVR